MSLAVPTRISRDRREQITRHRSFVEHKRLRGCLAASPRGVTPKSFSLSGSAPRSTRRIIISPRPRESNVALQNVAERVWPIDRRTRIAQQCSRVNPPFQRRKTQCGPSFCVGCIEVRTAGNEFRDARCIALKRCEVETCSLTSKTREPGIGFEPMTC